MQPRRRCSSHVLGCAAFVAPPAHVVAIDGASVWNNEGAVVTPDGCLVADLARVATRALEDHPIWRAHTTEYWDVEGAVAVVAARAAAHNFSHFLADTVPRIQLVRDSGMPVDRWLISGDDHEWQREILLLLGIGPEETISAKLHPHIKADRLVIPSRSGFAPYTAPWARDRALRALPPVSGLPRDRRIFISRSRARWRRLLNEDQIARTLATHGFETVDLESLPYPKQSELMASAQVIVSPHGAGLAHLLTVPDEGVVVELAHPEALHPEYYGLASLAGWKHRLVLSTGLEEQGEPPAILKDLWCDPVDVLRALEDAGVEM